MNTNTKVSIIGVGFVGLHLVECFSRKYKLVAFDISQNRIDYLRKEHPKSNVMYTTDLSKTESSDLYCVSVPTLLNKEERNIDLKYVESAIEMVKSVAKPGSTVVLESSVCIGTSERLLSPLYEMGINVGFSPERVDPGRTDPLPWDIPKVISGLNKECLEKVQSFYSNVYTQVVPVSSMRTAEMCKLYENCFRMINISYVNQASDACEKLDIDPKEMLTACDTKPYGYMPFYPGLGVGGTCIPVNPYYLFTNCDLPILKEATSHSETRPLKKCLEVIEQYNPQKCLSVGIAFKPGQSVTYESPYLSFANFMYKNGVNTTVYDTMVKHDKLKNLEDKDWNPKYIDDNFDLVCVCMKQFNIDFDILKDLKKCKVVYL
jgi:nucleotide sugar dehydrogenase